MTRPDAVQTAAAALDLVALEALALPETTGLALLASVPGGEVEALLLYRRESSSVDPVEGAPGAAFVKVAPAPLRLILEALRANDPEDPEELEPAAVIRSALLLGKALAPSEARRRILDGALKGVRELEEEEALEAEESEEWGCYGCGQVYVYPMGAAVEDDELCDVCGDVLVPAAVLEEEALELERQEAEDLRLELEDGDRDNVIVLSQVDPGGDQ